jgi:MOSC domain-containing protein YiiM
MELRLESVNVGQIRRIGTRDGEPLMSAIAKERVSAPSIQVRALGLEGDVQANPRVHGGPDKAVYAYPADNWAWWELEKRFACRPGVFGENLTLRGADETDVHIGDRFAWGEAILEISQPRSPCHKFQTFSQRQDASALMTISGRCGWYMRVIREGMAPVETYIERISKSDGPTVREAFHAHFNKKTDPEIRARVAAFPALSDAWRAHFADKVIS